MRNVQIFDLSAVFAKQIAVSKPLIREAYEKLGETEVKALKYHTGNIRRKLVARLHTSNIDKVVRLCKQTFPEQNPIPLTRIKHELQAIYDQLVSHTRPKQRIFSSGVKPKNRRSIRMEKR